MPLHYELQSGDIVEVLTSKRERGPSRDWLAMVKTTRARNKIRAWFKAESREDSEHTGRELLQEHLKKAGLPAQKITGSALLADVIREMGFRKADDFYIALGGAKISAKVVVNKVHAAPQAGRGRRRGADGRRGPGLRRARCRAGPRATRRSTASASRASRTCRCAWPSAAARCRATRSSATSRSAAGSRSTARTARTRAALRKDPERFVPVSWDGDSAASFKVELQVDGWDRHRLLEDLSRTFAEAGINIVEARCIVTHPMVKNRFVVEVGDTQTLKVDDHAPARDRRGLRRLPRHAERRLAASTFRPPRRTLKTASSCVPDEVAVDLDRHRPVVGRAHPQPLEPVERVHAPVPADGRVARRAAGRRSSARRSRSRG